MISGTCSLWTTFAIKSLFRPLDPSPAAVWIAKYMYERGKKISQIARKKFGTQEYKKNVYQFGPLRHSQYGTSETQKTFGMQGHTNKNNNEIRIAVAIIDLFPIHFEYSHFFPREQLQLKQKIFIERAEWGLRGEILTGSAGNLALDLLEFNKTHKKQVSYSSPTLCITIQS